MAPSDREMFHLDGFQFPKGKDPMSSVKHIQTMLNQYTYMPGKKQNGVIDARLRFETNLRMIFEAIDYFSDFWDRPYFWSNVRECLGFHHNTTEFYLEDIVDRYCKGRRAYHLNADNKTTPPNRLAELADTVNDLRSRGPTTKNNNPWEEQARGWSRRRHAVLSSIGVLAAQVRDGTCAPQLRKGNRGSPLAPSSDNYHSRPTSSLASRITTPRDQEESNHSSLVSVRGPPSIQESPRSISNKPSGRGPSISDLTSTNVARHTSLRPGEKHEPDATLPQKPRHENRELMPETLTELFAKHSTLPKITDSTMTNSNMETKDANKPSASDGAVPNNKRPRPLHFDNATNPPKRPARESSVSSVLSPTAHSPTMARFRAQSPGPYGSMADDALDSTNETTIVDISAVIDSLRGHKASLGSEKTADSAKDTAAQSNAALHVPTDDACLKQKPTEVARGVSESGANGEPKVNFGTSASITPPNSEDRSSKVAPEMTAVRSNTVDEGQREMMRISDEMYIQQKSMIELQKDLERTANESSSALRQLEKYLKKLDNSVTKTNELELLVKKQQVQLSQRTEQERVVRIEKAVTEIQRQLGEFSSNDDRIDGIEAYLDTIKQELTQSTPEEKMKRIEARLAQIQTPQNQITDLEQSSVELEGRIHDLKEQADQYATSSKVTEERLQAVQNQLTGMQEQIRRLQERSPAPPAAATTTLSHPHSTLGSRDFSYLADRDVPDFLKDIATEIKRLQSATRAKIHLMDAAGEPDGNRKYAISDVSTELTSALAKARQVLQGLA